MNEFDEAYRHQIVVLQGNAAHSYQQARGGDGKPNYSGSLAFGDGTFNDTWRIAAGRRAAAYSYMARKLAGIEP